MHGSSWIYHHRFWTEYPTEYPTDVQQRPHLRVGVDSTAPNQGGYWTVDLNNLKPWQKSSVAMLLSQVCASQLSDLVELVRGELSKLARRTLTASCPGEKGTAWNPRDDRDDLFFQCPTCPSNRWNLDLEVVSRHDTAKCSATFGS